MYPWIDALDDYLKRAKEYRKLNVLNSDVDVRERAKGRLEQAEHKLNRSFEYAVQSIAKNLVKK